MALAFEDNSAAMVVPAIGSVLVGRVVVVAAVVAVDRGPQGAEYVPSARTVWVFVVDLEVVIGDMRTVSARKVAGADKVPRVGVDTFAEMGVGCTDVRAGWRTGIVTVGSLASGWNRNMTAEVEGLVLFVAAGKSRLPRC